MDEAEVVEKDGRMYVVIPLDKLDYLQRSFVGLAQLIREWQGLGPLMVGKTPKEPKSPKARRIKQ